jgi:hypothetical protein
MIKHQAQRPLRQLGGCTAVRPADSLLRWLGGWAITHLADLLLH